MMTGIVATAAPMVKTASGTAIASGVWATATAVVTGLVMVGIAIIKQWGPWKLAATNEREGDFARLRNEIDGLHNEVKELRGLLDNERKAHEMQRSIDRHRLNNITQCFDALVMLLETNPERAKEALTKVKEMRESQMKAEAIEKMAARSIGAEIMP